MQRILFLAFLLTACASSETAEPRRAADPAEPTTTAFVGVNVIPMTAPGLVLPDQTVLVREGRIHQLGPRKAVDVPAGAERIEGADRYLLPGLADLHVHLEYFDDPALLLLFLDHGVTTVRNMDGRPYILEWRDKIASGELTGPTIITAGPLLDGDPPLRDDNTVVRNAEEARRIVAEQHAAGYDFVKVYTNLSREAWEAILAQAKAEGLPVAGHVPRRVRLEEALASGMASIEHLDGYDDLIESDDSPYRNRWHWAKMYLAMPADPAKMRAAAESTAKAGVWNVPTLVEKEKVGSVEEMTRWLQRPEIQSLPEEFRKAWDPAGWDEDRRRPYESISDEDRALLAQGRRQRLALVKALRDSGAGVLAGSDTPNPFVVPGLSLIEEIRLFVEAGLTPEQALTAATRDAARFLGKEKDFGTIAPGLRADLLFLESNPLDDIEHLDHRIGVMVRGTWIPVYHATPGAERK
jgi:imidazolonepropionase-like amidohydrolase